MEESPYDRLKRKVLADCGFDFNQYSQEYVKRRFTVRMMALNIPQDSWDAYERVLEKDRDEYVKLFDAFSINVTEFFRDISLWQLLRAKYFPDIITEKRITKPPVLCIWSAGCSSGEEPYSIAIILKEILPPTISLSILATDIDDDALRKAQEGVYRAESIKNIEQMDPLWKGRYFTEVPSDRPGSTAKKYRISEEIRRMVLFRKHSFLSSQLPGKMDIIFCRNAMIYLTPDVKRKLMGIFYDVLIPNGRLVLGKTEIIFAGRDNYSFSTEDIKEHVYRKTPRTEIRS